MPLLRAGELAKIVDKAEIGLALCDSRIADELVACAKDSRFLKKVINFDGTANHDAELDRVGAEQIGQVRTPCRPGATTWRCWASPRARPASPRPPCTSTATC